MLLRAVVRGVCGLVVVCCVLGFVELMHAAVCCCCCYWLLFVVGSCVLLLLVFDVVLV